MDCPTAASRSLICGWVAGVTVSCTSTAMDASLWIASASDRREGRTYRDQGGSADERALPVTCEQTAHGSRARRVQACCPAAVPAIAQERDDRRTFKERVRSMDLPLHDL